MVTALLFVLFKPVNRNISLIAALFSIAGCAIQSFACVFDLGALNVLEHGQSSSAFTGPQSQETVLMLLRLQGQGFNIAIVFFEFYCLLIGYLVVKSIFMPRVVGALMALGGLAYVGNNLALFLAMPLPMAFSHLAPIFGGFENSL